MAILFSKSRVLITFGSSTSGSSGSWGSRLRGLRGNGWRGWSSGLCGSRGDGLSGLRRRGRRSFLLRPCERFAHSIALQDDVSRVDFGQADAGGDVLALVHRQNLLPLELHHRVAEPAARGGHYAKQPDRNSGGCGHLVARHGAENCAGGSHTAALRRSRLHARLCARGKPRPGPVCEHRAKQRNRDQRERGNEDRLRKTGSTKRERLHSSSIAIRALKVVWPGAVIGRVHRSKHYIMETLVFEAARCICRSII